MKTLIVIISLFISIVPIYTQSTGGYASPLKYTTRLSGSYGEPRTAHFHSGIDFKQYKGVPFDSIFAVADGVISRISVKPDGYGNGLYINHPDGYTSVYAHLYDFNPEIRSFINKELYRRRTHRLDYDALSDSLMIKKGEFIGIMGNTGRSSAPHLHFEMRETKSEIPVNPALLGFKPLDNLAPTIKGIIIYDLGPDGEVYNKKYIPVSQSKNGIYTTGEKIIQVESLAVGIGVHCYDTMNGASNHNGIYSMKTKLNGDAFFSFALDKIPFDKAGYIHSHMDYTEKIANRYITKSFRAPYNQLDIYDDTLSNGVILTSEVIPMTLDIEVGDYDQNIAALRVQLMRSASLIPIKTSTNENTLRISPKDSLTIEKNNMHLYLPSYSVDRPYYLTPLSAADNEIDFELTEDIPIFKYLKLSAVVSQEKSNKHVFVTTNSKGELVHYGGKWENDSTIISFIDELKHFKLTQDTIAPVVKIISLPSQKDPRLAFTMEDNFIPGYSKDQLDFEVLIDDRWILCQYDIKTDKVTAQYIDTATGGRPHTLVIRVKDSVKNETVITRQFIL